MREFATYTALPTLALLWTKQIIRNTSRFPDNAKPERTGQDGTPYSMNAHGAPFTCLNRLTTSIDVYVAGLVVGGTPPLGCNF